ETHNSIKHLCGYISVHTNNEKEKMTTETGGLRYNQQTKTSRNNNSKHIRQHKNTRDQYPNGTT
ncbi:hypothetical protein, partial [Klebsiella pneumoniae]|uniref:hypothetical protein n=1 Tax=Klebsiella pneumoniae TaxID=573 RepID=UPI003EBA38A4